MEASGIPIYCSFNEIVPIKKAVPNPNNPNHHPSEQIRLLAKIIKAQGWRSPIVMSRRSGFIVKGHGRLMAAEVLDVDEVPVDWQEYATEAEEWADLQADNQIAELAEWDSEAAVAKMLEFDGEIDLELFGISEKDIDNFPVRDFDGLDDEFDVDPNEVQTDIQVGQIFKLGRHRLMCGDALNDLHINQLLGAADPDFLFTDPPYEFDMTQLFNILPNINVCHYLFMVGFKQMIDLVKLKYLKPRFDLIYVRSNITSPMGNNKVPHYKHVQLIYFTSGDSKTIFDKRRACGAFSEKALYPTVIEEEKHVSKSEFGYGKDMGAICKIISGFKFDTMLDLFAGSGTFLMACEKMGKTCYAMELDPKSCQLIIDRYENATGEEAQKILET